MSFEIIYHAVEADGAQMNAVTVAVIGNELAVGAFEHRGGIGVVRAGFFGYLEYPAVCTVDDGVVDAVILASYIASTG